MKDPAFIQDQLARGKEAALKVKEEFSLLSSEQLKWKPDPQIWNIGQCLSHLIVSDSCYFPAFRKITTGEYKMSFWEGANPFSGFLGKMLINQTQEKVIKKVKAPKIFLPPPITIDKSVIDNFYKHQETLMEFIAACKQIDVDKLHITSPVGRFVTYSLRHAITILVEHEHRHINQAIRVKQLKDFPA